MPVARRRARAGRRDRCSRRREKRRRPPPGETVESVLAQTLRDLELIVVDDASTDGTQALLDAVADERVRVVRNDEHVGLAASLNRGLDLADARYVARLDADDIALPERLE